MPGYLGNDPAGSATKIARQTYTTSGAATTDFTFTSGYDVGYLDVYINGERQTKGTNFTASDGSTFRVLNGGVGTGSTVEAIAYKTFNLATVDFDDLGNTGNLTLSGDISAVDASFSGDVSIGGTLTYEDVTNIDSVGIITARSYVSIADSIVHTGDINTAIRFPAADTFTVETGGAEAIRIDGSQRLFVGLTSFTGEASAVLEGSSAGDNVQAQLWLNRGAANPVIDLLLGMINFGDSDAAGHMGAKIDVRTDGNWSSGNYPSRLMFHTTASGESSPTERLRITSGGLVGIGTTNPAGTLEIDAASTTDMIMLDAAGTNFARLGHNTASGTDILDVRSEGHIRFLTNGNNERFRITNGGTIFTTNATAAGSLGVGTDSPGKVSGMSRYLALSAAAADNAVGFELQGNRSGNDEPVARISIINDDTECARITIDSDASGTPAGGNMLFATGGSTERMRLRSDGPHLLVGTGGDASYNEITESSSNAGLVIGSSSVGNGGIVIRTSTSGTGRIYFADNSGTDAGRNVGNIRYQHSDDTLRMSAGGSEAVVVDAAGNFNITGITTASQLFEGTTRVATSGKAIAMALIFG